MIPGVKITISDGALGGQNSYRDGVAGLICTTTNESLEGKLFLLNKLKEAEDSDITKEKEFLAYKHIKEFYDVTGDGADLYVMLVKSTATFKDILSAEYDNNIKRLVDYSQGAIRLVGISKEMPKTTNGEKFLDQDVYDAVMSSADFLKQMQKDIQPIRVLVEGIVANEEAIPTPLNTYVNQFVGVVVGGTEADNSASVGLVLGKAAKSSVHENIGKVLNGGLPVSALYIAGTPIEEFSRLDNIIDGGHITFKKYPHVNAYYVSDDPMCIGGTSDFSILANGRVIDKAIIIAYQTYVQQVNNNLTVTGGKIDPVMIKNLQNTIDNNVLNAMGTEISDFHSYIDEKQDILATKKMNIQLRVVPVGYMKEIVIDLGFAKQ